MPATSEDGGGRRLALVIATSSYSDSTLTRLRAPGRDARSFAQVLGDPAIGGFDVDTLLDAPADTVRRRLAQFCTQGGPRDLVLIYLSCHGLLDDRGRLYYATTDTDRELLSVTAVQAAWFNEHLDDCRCRRQILVLDCCHSGAFAQGAKGDDALALRERFGGRGRVVLTASRATEYSFEGGSIAGESTSSVFTGALVDGLRSGEADRDGDGLVTVTELYDHAYDAVKASEARQTPCLWTYGAEGSLLVAHSPRGAVVQAAPLPADLLTALDSSQPRIRQGAVGGLADVLAGPDAGRALSAAEPAGHGARRAPAAGLRVAPAAVARALARHKGRAALLVVALLALIVGLQALRDGGSGGTSEKTGGQISMLSTGTDKTIASVHLGYYDTPPMTLHIELTPGGEHYRLLLFDRLSDVRSFDKLPSSALLVDGGGPGGDLRSSSTPDEGYSWSYSPGLPANFRQYRYFGIAGVAGSRGKLVLYDRVDRLPDPR